MDKLVLEQIYSDMLYTTAKEVKDNKKKSRIDKLVLELNKFYDKHKMVNVPYKNKLKSLENEYKQKIKDIQEYSKDKDYSMVILCVAMLDYMTNVRPIEHLKKKFGHIDTHKMLFECEKHHREPTFNSYKLITTIEDKQ